MGKSVEMLANAIAEMRTYGEGFIIADQSPSLMDMAVIRNTNTKIIMRLPDEGDRLLVGKAAGLNDVQIEEVSKLETGVAAISQSGWLEPVLCKIDMLDNDKRKRLMYSSQKWIPKDIQALRKFFANTFTETKKELNAEEVDIVRKWKDRIAFDVGWKNDELIRENAIAVVEDAISLKHITDDEKWLLASVVVGTRVSSAKTPDTLREVINNEFMSRFGLEADSEIVRNIVGLMLTRLPIIMQTAMERACIERIVR